MLLTQKEDSATSGDAPTVAALRRVPGGGMAHVALEISIDRTASKCSNESYASMAILPITAGDWRVDSLYGVEPLWNTARASKRGPSELPNEPKPIKVNQGESR